MVYGTSNLLVTEIRSSVHAQLISGVSGWGYAIQKQECANHAVK